MLESFNRMIEDAEAARKKARAIARVAGPALARDASEQAKKIGDIRLYSVFDEELDDDYYIAIGEKAIELDPSLVFVAFVAKGQGMRVIVFAGEQARKKSVKAGALAKQLSAKLGGSGGGDDRFGQGGGRLKERVKEALLLAEEMVAKAGL
ncbi:MAG: hypothetical protein C4292_03905 [Nitrososphaera sp.]